jgi:tripartite-type tricarboxylate transporter receptor subunit TctC
MEAETTPMRIPHRKRFQSIAGSIALISSVLLSEIAWSQARIVKLVIPYPPGGVNESMARVMADYIGRQGGPTFVIESRPGAGTMIGTEAVSRAAPDGNTVLIVSNSFVINAHLKKLTYDPLTSFEPICYLWKSPGVFVVNSNSPNKTLGDLLSAARNRTGVVTMGMSGPATGFHLGFEQLKRTANVDITMVPFGGSGPAITALLGEHVVSAFVDYGLAAEHLNSGKLRALATAGKERSEPLPKVPTVAEAGVADYDVDIWYGLVAPANTSREGIAQFITWLSSAMQDSGVRAKLASVGLYPVGQCGAEFGAHIRNQHEFYGRLIREAKIKAE